MLQFNSTGCFQALRNELIKTANLLADEYLQEVTSHLSSGAGDVEKGISSDDAAMLRREIVGGALAIMDSYGTGSKMDMGNPFLGEYMGSGAWNPSRYGSTIVGRPAGSYTNIFGETQESSGKMEGHDVEHVYPPRAPSKAFQDALVWLKAGNRFHKRINECIQSFDFSKYFIES